MNDQHTFNSIRPVAYFLTFNTYGSWFHGDENGSVNRRQNNIPNTPVLKLNKKLECYEKRNCKQESVRFNWQQRKLIEKIITEVCEYNRWILHSANARTEHVHVVVTALKSPEIVMNCFKSWCTRRLREHQLLPLDIRPWSRHGSTRYLWDEKALHDACRYVTEFQDDKPGIVHEDALPLGRASE
jgi:REP element-mobilizing transposase RayT